MTNNPMPQSIVIGFIGKMGSGKTLNMTKWALMLKENTGLEVWANYHIKGCHYWNKIKKIQDQVNIIVVVDEIHVLFDSRDWDTKERYAFTQWFTQIRHRGIVFIYATQRTDTLEKRIRNHTDYMIWCSKQSTLNAKKEKQYIFTEKIYDTQMSLDQAIYCKTLKTPEKNAKWLYNVYDTTEIIEQSK